jgi:hypothetical protein
MSDAVVLHRFVRVTILDMKEFNLSTAFVCLNVVFLTSFSFTFHFLFVHSLHSVDI